MSSNIPMAPQGAMPAIGIPNSQDYPRLVYSAPYFLEVPLAELIEPSVIEAVENQLPSLVPPYVDAAAQAAVQQLAVLLTGSTMSGPLFLSPLMPTQPSQAATMAYVDSMVATAGIPEVPPVPSGQVWARETGQWVPITPQTGVFLPLAGGSMVGNINMSGNTITNMAAVPAMPNGAAPAQWVLNQIASVSLYQGTWDADNNVPDLTQLSTHVNAYTWIALTTSVSGVVIGPAIPGLQGTTIYNGDTVIYSTVQGGFRSIHAGGITLPEADARYVALAGSQMSGALLLNANASQPLQAVTLQQLDAYVPPGSVGEAPNDGQLYGRNGLTHAWSPVLPLAGGILTGSLTLFGNATANLNPVPLQQMTSAISAATAGYLPLAGAAMTGLMTLSGNASVGLNPVPLQQLTGMLASYAALSGASFTGPVTLPTGSTVNGYLPLSGGALTGALTSSAGIVGAGIQSNAQVTGVTAAFSSTVTLSGPAECNSVHIPVSPLYITPSMGVLTVENLSATACTFGDFATAGACVVVVLSQPIGMIQFQNFNGSTYTPIGVIQSNGTSVSYNQTSDVRLKENIKPFDGSGELLDLLEPIEFDWRDAPENAEPHGFGFSAQDAHAVFPHAVTPGQGEPRDADFQPWGMDNSKLMPIAIAELKALRARVAALEAKTVR